MANITWNGLEVTGNVEHDRGTYWEPPFTEVSDIDIEGVDDEDEFSLFLEEHEKPAEWKTLPKEAVDWIVGKYEDDLAERLIEDHFDS
jgi:hypothetical protein